MFNGIYINQMSYLFFVIIGLFSLSAVASTDNNHFMLSYLENYGPTNAPNLFVIQAYEESGDPINSGGALLKAEIKGANVSYITDNNDGTYVGIWSSNITGTYYLYISLIKVSMVDDETFIKFSLVEEIHGSPFQVMTYNPIVDYSA